MGRHRRKKGDGGLYHQVAHRASRDYDYWIAEWRDRDGHKRRAHGSTPEAALERRNARIHDEEAAPRPRAHRDTVGTSRNPTVRQAMEHWLLGSETIAEISRGKYRRNLERYVMPYLGSRAVRGLKTSDMSTLKATWHEREVGPSAMAHTWQTLHTMLNSLVREGMLRRNVMDAIDAPRRTNRRAAHIDAYIDEHLMTAQGIISWTGTEGTPCHEYYPLVMALALGLRRAEALGLTQEALHASDETLDVRARLKQRPGGGYYLQPATKNGRCRTIYLPHIHYQALSSAIRSDAVTLPIQEEDGTRIGEGKILLTRKSGGHYSYNDWRDTWILVQEEYKRHVWGRDARLEPDEYIVPHEMRHITASMLSAEGETLETIQSILGHTTREMSGHYTHPTEGGRMEVARRWGESLEGAADVVGFVMGEIALGSAERDAQSAESASEG